MPDNIEYAHLANAIRALAVDSVENAGSGHPGMPLGMADVATVLFRNHLSFVASDPEWMNRDRLVLSAGHGSILLYTLLYLTGTPDMDLGQLKSLRKWGSLTPGHPEYGHTRGVEMTTGPLGQGVASAVGMAISERKANAEFGNKTIDHFTYVIAGDGCLMEGVSHEAASLAGHLNLSKLIVLFDDNGITIDGTTDIAQSENISQRYESYGWNTIRVDGHDYEAIDVAIKAARHSNGPSLICCKTTIGKGAPTQSGTSKIHGSPLGKDEILQFKKTIEWPERPFHCPKIIKAEWRKIGSRQLEVREAWTTRLNQLDKATYDRMEAYRGGSAIFDWSEGIFAFKSEVREHQSDEASRISSQKLLERLVPMSPWLVGGSADLSGSNGTRTVGHIDFTPDQHQGNYIRYGVREHAMAAIMNGIALHGPYVPYGGTFLVFSDYCRPAIRLSALMKLNVIYVMTHDSIGLGADGPTHQPIEHVQSLRLIPNLNVFRPCDAVETAECWELAGCSKATPSILILSRQNLPLLRNEVPHLNENKVSKGAYIISDCQNPKRVTVFATGSEISIAIEVQTALERAGIGTVVVSVPCQELFWQQTDDYKSRILDISTLRVSIEAGTVSGWARWVGDDGITIGLDQFGASAAGPKLYEEFGLTVDVISKKIIQKIEEERS